MLGSREFAGPDLTDEAWEARNEIEDAKARDHDINVFLDDAQTVAHFIRAQVADRDSVDGADVLAFIAEGGLERNVEEVAKTAIAEYRRFLLGRPILRADLIVDTMVEYYTALSTTLKGKGVTL